MLYILSYVVDGNGEDDSAVVVYYYIAQYDKIISPTDVRGSTTSKYDLVMLASVLYQQERHGLQCSYN
jgi:hypothetical protein